jgi:chaperone required for assembly of F1-ATPase
MAKKKNKRFYKDVSTSEVEGGFHILLDGRILKTPGKKTLLVPTQNAADLIQSEWESQGEEIDPTSMPVTRLLNVAVEQTPDNRHTLIAEARKYAGTDVLCYREGGVRLHKEHQSEHWDPILAWAKEQDIKLNVTDGIKAIAQPEKALDKVAEYAEQLDDMSLTLYVHLTAVYGSAILAMAVMNGHISGEEGYRLSRLDELWQIRYWGEDEEAAERSKEIEVEVLALCQLLED